MSAPTIALNENTYLTLDEVREWLAIDDSVTKRDNILRRLINTACTRVEQYIEGPVLTRQFVESQDGNSSNVIVPSHYPVVSVDEVKIDFQRNFDSAVAVSAENVVLRGIPSLKQSDIATPAVEVRGTDVILRDDSSSAVIGRIFAGSVLQSIQITYSAGYGDDSTDLPQDLVTATLMLVEFMYLMKENKDVSIKSKNTMGPQGYTRADVDEDSGMPKEIVAMLNSYKDVALPTVAVPQRNTFKI